jgi:ATP-dependent RNA helicase DeaD
MYFEDMNIEKSVLDSLDGLGFKTPTTIQCKTIPVIKQGNDVIGQSKTGSGKTGAFGIPLVEAVSKNGKLQAIVLAPTRELARQIANELKKFSRVKGLRIQTIYGGVGMRPQVSGLRRSEIVVGTPGRILDHMARGNMNTNNIKIFVLDEADRMIDMGFIDDIQEIERNIPKDRQTLLFSATMSENVVGMTKRFTKNAKRIKTTTKISEKILRQYYYDVDHRKKFSLLVHLIRQEKPAHAIVFCNTRKDVDNISSNLRENGIDVKSLHGGLTQSRREKVMKNFYNGTTKILAATDVAGRGLDVKNVTHIFNYGIPKNAEDYVNRIGRTARAGETGKAISLLCRNDYESFRKIINRYPYDVNKMRAGNFKILPFKMSYSRRRRGFSRRNFSRRRSYSKSFR